MIKHLVLNHIGGSTLINYMWNGMNIELAIPTLLTLEEAEELIDNQPSEFHADNEVEMPADEY